MSTSTANVSLIVGAVCAGLVSTAPARATSPLGKTIDVTSQACVNGNCTPSQRFHIYVSPSGQVYSFANKGGGRKSALGETFKTDSGAGRFTVQANAIVFEGAVAQNANTLRARATVLINGRRCSVSWQAEFNGQEVPMEARSGPCRVYTGQKPY